MKKKILFLVIACIVSAFFASDIYAEEPVTDKSVRTLLMEAETGTVIRENGGYIQAPQGTLNKLMTVLLAAEEIENGSLSMESVMSTSSNANSQKGAVIWLSAGEAITVREALKAVIIGNANDAAMVIAEEIGGSEEEFVRMMNARAFELGMKDTVFGNAAGYDCEVQHSTAYDIAVLCRELLKYEFLYDIMNTWIDRVRDDKTEIVNENRLVRNYDGIIGLKASHSEKSGYCLAMAAERGGKCYIAVVMGCGDENERFSIGKSLMSDGFSNYKNTTPSFSGEFIKPISVKGGIDRFVSVTAEKLNELVIPERSGEISTVVFMPEYIDAPVVKGQRIGAIGFYNGDTLIYETNLITEDKVDKISIKSSVNTFLEKIYK